MSLPSKITSAYSLYRNEGLQPVIGEVYSRAVTLATRQDIIDSRCLRASLQQLEKRKDAEEPNPSPEDILTTTGYTVAYEPAVHKEDWEAGNKPYRGIGQYPGRYRGYGVYNSLSMMQEFESIQALSQELMNQNVDNLLEIGSANGGSFYLWNRILNPSLAISIDISYDANQPVFFSKFSDAKTVCIEGASTDSKTVEEVKNTIDNGLDFVYIDGDHSYEQSKRDFEAYREHVTDGGLIGLHDISHPGTGVPKLWRELKADYETEEFGSSVFKNGLVHL